MPLPAEAKESLPDCALANRTSSFTDFAGTEGWTTSIRFCVATSDTAAKSLTGS